MLNIDLPEIKWYCLTSLTKKLLYDGIPLSLELYECNEKQQKVFFSSNLIMYKLRILYYSSLYNFVRSLSLSNIHLASEFFFFSDYLHTRCPILDETWRTKVEKHTKWSFNSNIANYSYVFAVTKTLCCVYIDQNKRNNRHNSNSHFQCY